MKNVLCLVILALGGQLLQFFKYIYNCSPFTIYHEYEECFVFGDPSTGWTIVVILLNTSTIVNHLPFTMNMKNVLCLVTLALGGQSHLPILAHSPHFHHTRACNQERIFNTPLILYYV